MILRGESHVLYNRSELMERLKKPSTIAVLDQLEYFYDCHLRRKEAEEQRAGGSGIEVEGFYSGEMWELNRLIQLTKTWLSPPVRVNFKEMKNGKNKSRNHADADGSNRRSKGNVRT